MEGITTNFGFYSTAKEVIAGIDLTGRRAVVTGAASGIGLVTAETLALAGAEVTIAVRNMDAGNKAAAEIIKRTGNNDVYAERLDLADLNSIRSFAAGWKSKLHILINNAGIMALPELQLTPQGYEMQFATNHLGHFALAVYLHDALAASGSARIVAVSSSGHMLSPVIFDDINFVFRRYDPTIAYGQSKTANILFAVETSNRWAKDGITANALHPGAILTNLQRHVGNKLLSSSDWQKSPGQGAATSILLATSPLLEGIGGRYFENCNETLPSSVRHDYNSGLAPYAVNADNAKRLWEESLTMIE